ncbi:MAG: hypothetical protein KDA48_09020 [Amphiplicatus sp.]|nr:hypothetical protein [Amphiplicatus sp.]MCB9955605.1 hypothetical protein [Caulobacterales bacterium]
MSASQTVSYRHVGKCVYCPNPRGLRLTTEHIIPEKLGGKEVLYAASCDDCREKTQKIESHVLSQMLDGARAYLGLRGQKRGAPQRGHAYVRDAENNPRAISIDPAEAPIGAILPHWGPPTILMKPGATWPGRPSLKLYGSETKLAEWMSVYGSYVSGKLRPELFVQMLAKIAHCCTIDAVGIDAFEPYLPPIILGDMSTAPRLIGCHKFEPAQKPGNAYRIEQRSIEIFNVEYFLVIIRLFTYWETPTYWVIAGHPKGPPSPRAFGPLPPRSPES